MRIAIFGAGAIGGYLGVRLQQAGLDVTFIARGPHLAAMQADGVTLISGEERVTVRPRCVDSAAEAGPQDYVFVTLKAHALPGAAPDIARMLVDDDAALVTGINGVPYWYFHGVESPYAGRPVQSVDPGGRLLEILPPARAIGCVVYPAAEVEAPGVIRHTYGDRFILGEPDGSRSPRVERLSKALVGAGLSAPVRTRIRDDIWVKLWGNMAFNPLSALTASTLDRLALQPDLRAVVRALMLEGQAIARALGVRLAIDVDRRIEGAGEVGAHKTSMLQDLERGRPMEIDALLGAVVELGEVVAVPTPMSAMILALVRERARQAGCY
ncbi:2-dehydropantoate 2-reductase [Acidisphaera rubrifaciens]|uniref:2-dehydropantoate 2-reductase n=1 Tax=Acidisphaera rubrifaciens HS-AP3 TaxID=1231350 RepID=A0A0D6P7B1_9PROT|nr:2-dehydropantoate 2-reductase [Acidisphaera rubrifaciens]GAN77098.1 2-dehydropantoate 2-reductase [Acidisphaera rubrifaciens HS-AP3]